MDDNKIKEYWDNVASMSKNDPVNAGMLGPGTRFFADYRKTQEEKAFNQLVNINTINTVLEVGCGGGRWCFYLADKVSHVTGIDISEEMISLCKKTADNKKIENADFITIDFLSLPNNRKYDLVYFSGVLQYIDDDTIAKILSKLEGLLNNNAVVLSRDTIQEKQRVEKSGDYPVTYRTQQEYKNLFLKAGYHMVGTMLAYDNPRFSMVVDLFYYPPALGLGFALSISKALNKLNALLGNPKWLMRKSLRKAIESGNQQSHVFSTYTKT